MSVHHLNEYSVTTQPSRMYPSRFHSRYVALVRLREALEYVIDKYVAGSGWSTLLDAGAGTAPYRTLFDPHVEAYLTADLPGTGADHEFNGDGGLPLPSDSIDLTLSNQVLEHVPDPAAHLAELYRVTRPAGQLILSTHGYWMYHPNPGDYTRWTGPGLRAVIERAGFEIVETVGVIGRGASGVQLIHDALNERLLYRLRAPFAFLTQIAMIVVDRLDRSNRENDACKFVIVAKKPST